MDDMTSKILTDMILVLINVLLPVLLGYAVSGIKKNLAVAKANQPDIFFVVQEAARAAVTAAEQVGLPGQGKAKKEYALEVAEKWLDEKGVTIDLHLLDAAIEAQVYRQFNEGAPWVVPPPQPVTSAPVSAE
jgi:hypothetical protein